MEPRRRRVRPLALMLCWIGIIAIMPVRAGAQEDPLEAVAGTEVRVSRQEVTVTFPVDMAHWWGWSEGNGGSGPYFWRLRMDDEGPPRAISLRIEPRPGRIYRSLRALVSDIYGRVCLPDPYCGGAPVRASVTDSRLVLTLRDSAAISELFGLRPDSATAHRSGPDMRGEVKSPVRVTYVDPQLPPADSAMRAAAAERRRRHLARADYGRRVIVAQPHGHLWLVVGDSAAAHVQQSRCSYNVCVVLGPQFPKARWSVADSSIARFHPDGKGAVQVVALRPGRTVLRATGLAGPGDTVGVNDPLPGEVEQEVVVTGPVTAVRICPRWPVYAGAPFPLHVEVVDSENNVFRDPPVRIALADGSIAPSDTAGVLFHGSGSITLRAAFAGRADTLRLRVIQGRRGPEVHQGNEREGCYASALTSVLPAARPRDD